jgi:hypothetical protein
MGVCAKHWPENEKFVKFKSCMRPTNPPSIFPGCAPSMLPQTFAGRQYKYCKVHYVVYDAPVKSYREKNRVTS